MRPRPSAFADPRDGAARTELPPDDPGVLVALVADLRRRDRGTTVRSPLRHQLTSHKARNASTLSWRRRLPSAGRARSLPSSSRGLMPRPASSPLPLRIRQRTSRAASSSRHRSPRPKGRRQPPRLPSGRAEVLLADHRRVRKPGRAPQSHREGARAQPTSIGLFVLLPR